MHDTLQVLPKHCNSGYVSRSFNWPRNGKNIAAQERKTSSGFWAGDWQEIKYLKCWDDDNDDDDLYLWTRWFMMIHDDYTTFVTKLPILAARRWAGHERHQRHSERHLYPASSGWTSRVPIPNALGETSTMFSVVNSTHKNWGPAFSHGSFLWLTPW